MPGRNDSNHHSPRAATSAPAVVAAELRQAIIRGDLLPGEQIRQIDWARRLGVSQVPIREALKTLAAEGVLTHGHHRGYFVARFASAEVAEIYLMRRVLERELLQMIAWPDRRVLRRLRGLAEQLRAQLLQEDLEKWTELDRRFWSEIHALSPGTVLPMELDRLWLLSSIYRSIVGWPAVDGFTDPAEFYGRVVDALTEHDRARLVELVEKQLARAQAGHVERWRQREARYGGPRSTGRGG
jgi:DNA-binding GntR family transcriptional regulator